MNEFEEQTAVKVHRTSVVVKGFSGNAPVSDPGPLQPMEPHVVIRLHGEEYDIICQMSKDVARVLKQQLLLFV